MVILSQTREVNLAGSLPSICMLLYEFDEKSARWVMRYKTGVVTIAILAGRIQILGSWSAGLLLL